MEVFWLSSNFCFSMLFYHSHHLYVAGCSYITAVIVPVLTFAPMTLTTPIVEAKIFRSKFLVLHIERGGKLINQIRKGGTQSQIVMFIFNSLVFSTIILSVSVFGLLGMPRAKASISCTLSY